MVEEARRHVVDEALEHVWLDGGPPADKCDMHRCIAIGQRIGEGRSRHAHTIDPLRVAFVLQDLQLSGGVGVVVEHARHLRADHGIDAQLVLAQEELHPRWPFRGLDEVPVLTYDEALGRGVGHRCSAVVADDRRAVSPAVERYAYFIQALEDSLFQPNDPERVTAALTTSLPVRFITEAQWIVEMLAALQPGNDAHYVRNGIAKEIFTPPDTVPDLGDGPLRVVIEGARDVPLKGIDQALEAVGLMTEPAHVTWVAPHGTTDAPPAVDQVLSRLTHPEMAQLFFDSHVLLKLSRAEGMYGPPLEAFHCGATVVTTAVTGHDEYVRHAENGLVVGWDDARYGARLDLLARDR